MKVLLLCFLLLSNDAVSQTPDPTPVDARVSGTVVDVKGKPVSPATVYLEEQASLLSDPYRAQTKTDVAGRFDFGEKLKHGVYNIYAAKEKECYPDPSSPFYRAVDFNPETVQLFGQHPEAKVQVALGEKAGVLVGKVIDADTELPLKAGITLFNVQTGADHGDVVHGKFRELVPANTDVHVIVEDVNSDHALWSPFDLELTLKPGEERNLDIRLYKNPNP